MTTEPLSPPERGARAATAPAPFVAPPVDVALLVLTAVSVVAGVALRFAPRSGLWLDEALTVNIASLPLGDIGDALRRDGHPPLFYVLLHGWIALGGDGDGWVRALAGVISVLSLPLTYLAGHRLAERSGAGPLGSRRTGLIALSIMSVLPYAVRYGAETRMYSLVITLVLAGYLLVDELLVGRSSGTRRALVTVSAALVATALLWTHYWSMWLLAAVGLVVLVLAVRATEPRRRTGARLVVTALVAGGLLFLPWVPALLYQSSNTGTPWGERFGPASVLVVSIVDFSGARHGAAQLLSYVLVVLVLLAATVHIVAAREQGPDRDSLVLEAGIRPRVRVELIIMGLTMVLGWAAAFATDNTFASRYAAVVVALFVLCVAAGIAVVRRPLAANLLLAVVVALSVFGALGEVRFPRSQTGEVVEEIAADVEANSVERAVVVACPDQLGVALQRQVEQQLAEGPVVIPFPTAGDPDFVDWVDYGARNTASDPAAFVAELGDRVPGDATVYVVSNSTYRTFEGKCEQLVATLGAGREVTQVVTSAPDDHEEPADLLVMRPAT